MTAPIWPTGRRVWPLYTGLVLLVVAALLGALLLWGVPGARDVDRAATTAPPTLAVPASPEEPEPASQPGRPEPELVTWGGRTRQLALVIRNDSDRLIRRARVAITARDAAGGVVASSTGPRRSTCCTVLGLPPRGEYGLFLDLDRPVRDVATVEVRYARVRAVPAGRSGRGIEVHRASLERTPDDTVVAATLAAAGPLDGYVIGQAFLVDRNDRLVGVISGRFYCFYDDTVRRVRMQLLRGTPPGTRIQRVLAYPVPSGVPAHVPHHCPPDSESR